MRLPEVERGDTFAHRMTIRMISRAAGYRIPDAARVAFYDKAFVGPALGAWTQRTMRGPSAWSVSERELMAAQVAKWNSCPFCVGAHGSIAVKGMDQAIVEAVLADYRTAGISDRLRAALAFLDRMTNDPDHLDADAARTASVAGLTPQDLEDAAAVGAVFAIITRYANTLGFEIPTAEEFDRAADMLLKRGYG
jgi:uncharacterized peroxidase-related enzyme